MTKKYSRKSLNQAIAATCLSVVLAGGINVAPADAFDYVVSSGETWGATWLIGSNDSLTIDAGGVIADSDALLVTCGPIAGGITNNGTISGYYGTGIVINTTSDLAGGITNSGTISGQESGVLIRNNSDVSGGILNQTTGSITGSATGIRVYGAEVSGGINNSGEITGSDIGIEVSDSDVNGITNQSGGLIGGTGSSGIGIDIGNVGTVSADINNSGTISGGFAGLFVFESSTLDGAVINDGTIEGVSSAIQVDYNSQITQGIDNSGTISGSDYGVKVGGLLGNGTISGGITNSGTISGSEAGIFIDSSSAVNGGITVQSSGEIIGGIDNAGTISNTSGNGISVRDSSTLTGSIDNSGRISGQESGILIRTNSDVSGGILNQTTGSITGSATGIRVYGAEVSGGINNSGEITGSDIGIEVSDSDVNGITNQSGGLIGGTGSSGIGIDIGNVGTVSADINNSGTISGGFAGLFVFESSTLDGAVINDGTIEGVSSAIQVDYNSQITQGIDNSGTISGSDYGVKVGGLLGNGTISGGITNSGTISGSEAGIFIDSSSAVNGGITVLSSGVINGGIDNAGTISNTSGDGISVSDSSTLTGGIDNSGLIHADGWSNGVEVQNDSQLDGGIVNQVESTIEGIFAGIFLENSSTINGGIDNQGLIQADYYGIYLCSDVTLNGGIDNSGTISGDQGIHLESNSILNGGIVNSGTISGISAGIYVDSSSSIFDGITVQSSGVVNGGIVNDGTISKISHTAGYAIWLRGDSTVNGGIDNTGTIISNYAINIYQSTVNDGINNSGTMTGSFNAILINDSEITGGITNQVDGEIAGNMGAIRFSSSTIDFITNAGSIYGQESDAKGITLYTSEITGQLTNSGTISAGTSSDACGVFLINGTISGGVVNSGTITAIGSGIKLYDSSIAGITNQTGGLLHGSTEAGIYLKSLTNGSYITGGIDNSGTISGELGIDIDNSTVDTITNSGTISADRTGLIVESGGTVTGSVTNTGSIYGDNYGILSDGTGTDIVGGIVNSGDIIGAEGIVIVSGGDISGGIDNQLGGVIGISATGVGAPNGGILIGASTMTGDINNSGFIVGAIGIFAVESSVVSGAITNSGTISAAFGITSYLGSDITGDITNSGTIQGEMNGIFVVENGTISGDIINTASGEIIGGEGGVQLVGSSEISGQINNAGVIAGSAGIAVMMGSDLSGGIVNSGTISGSVGIFVDSASNISGGIVNTGTISGSEYALVLETSAGPEPEVLGLATQIVIDNYNLIDGAVQLGNNILNLEGGSSRVTGIVTGDSGSIVNVNSDFTTEAALGADRLNIATDVSLNAGHDLGGTTALTNDGTLFVAAGNSITLTGNYIQSETGLFQTGATSLSEYGQMTVTGTADLSASNAIDVKVTANDTLAEGNVLADVISAGTLTAGTLEVTDNSAMWRFTGVKDGQTIDLVTAREMTYTDVVGGSSRVSGAAMGAAAALDAIQEAGASGDMQTVLNEMGALETEEEVAAAVGQTLPGTTGSVAEATLGTASEGGVRVVHDRVVRLNGLSSGDEMLKDRMLWGQTFYTNTDQDKHKDVYGYTGESFGIAIGADSKISQEWRLGAAISFARGDYDDDSPITDESLDVDTYQATLYATNALSEKTHLNLLAAFGVNDNDSTRNISFGGLNRKAKASYDSWHTHLDAELEHRYTLSEKTTLTPAVRAEYSYIDVDGYTEKGAGALNLKVDSDDADALIMSISGKLAYAMTEQTRLTGRLGVGYDLLADKSSLSSSYTGGGPSFTTKGLDQPAFLVRGGVGVDVLTDSAFEVTANYDAEAREDYLNHVVILNLRLPF